MSGDTASSGPLVCEEDILYLNDGSPGLYFTKKFGDIVTHAAQVLSQTPDGLSGHTLQYGHEVRDTAFRKQLAIFLQDQYGDKEPLNIENLMATSGSVHALYFVVNALLPGGLIFVEELTFYAMLDLFRQDLAMKIIPVKMDEEGMDVSDLEKLIVKHIDKDRAVTSSRPFRAMVYTIPEFNNPTSISLSPERRRQLVDLARQHDLLVFSDDAYNFINFKPGSGPPKRVVAYEHEKYGAEKGNVISAGSFSKIIGPGLRVGWLEASRNITSRLLRSEISTFCCTFNFYGIQLMTVVMKEGFVDIAIKEMNKCYSAKVKAVNEVLDSELSGIVKYTKPQGGYFYWLELPQELTADELALVAEKYNISFGLGQSFSAAGHFRNCIRISFGFYEKETLVRGVQLLSKAIKEALDK